MASSEEKIRKIQLIGVSMFEPKIIGFLCTWCSYTGADLAGTSRLKSPWNFRGIRVPCSGRVSPELIMRAFDQGADGVLVLGCHIGECHYDSGNHRTAKRIPVLQNMMAFAGLESERIRLDWVSASEGDRFAKIVSEFTEAVRTTGPVKWRTSTHDYLITSEEIEISNELKDIGLDWADINRIDEIQSQIHGHARELLEGGTVNTMIGYEVGPRGRTRPAFITEPDEAGRLVWNQACTHNLTKYLEEQLSSKDKTGHSRRAAIIVKPCDSKTINVLISENRIERENVHIIGVACEGIKDGAGFGKTNGNYQSRCLSCVDQEPVVYDKLLGDPGEARNVLDYSNSYLLKIENLSSKERMDFWLSQFDRCIRCYACRQACPLCSCPTCLYERNDSLWVGMNIELNEVRTFHLGRAYHLAGRCVGCNECERVCPMDIPISLLNQKLAHDLETNFDFRAGYEPVPSPLTTILDME